MIQLGFVWLPIETVLKCLLTLIVVLLTLVVRMQPVARRRTGCRLVPWSLNQGLWFVHD